MFTQNFKFSTCFPNAFLHPCSFYMQNAYEFLNETFRSEKGEKNFFLQTQHRHCFLHKYISVITTTKNIYMLIYKNVYAFFIKFLATAKQLIFHRVSIEIGLTPPPPPVYFDSLFKDRPSPLHNKHRVSHRC